MNIFKSPVKQLIEKKDFDQLNQLLTEQPHLANQGITIPFDMLSRVKAHPLHRLCDAVFAGKINDNVAVQLAKVLLKNGANIDGDKNKGEGTPLLAAASLHAEQVGILYISYGADIHHTYKNDGASALHWAAFCGKDLLVQRLIEAQASIDQADSNYQSTPLGWAIHALQSKDVQELENQVNCLKLLLEAGADPTTLDPSKIAYLRSLASEDSEIEQLLD